MHPTVTWSVNQSILCPETRLISCSESLIFDRCLVLHHHSLLNRTGPFLDICNRILLQIWGDTTATLKQCFSQVSSLSHRRALTLLLVYEGHEALQRLTDDIPSMRVADLTIKQAQRPKSFNDLERFCLSTKKCGERETA
jgi:hypothetical protein